MNIYPQFRLTVSVSSIDAVDRIRIREIYFTSLYLMINTNFTLQNESIIISFVPV